MSHTPGPWEAHYSSYGDELWFGGEGQGMWSIGPPGFDKLKAYLGGIADSAEGRAEMEANARLIAAAPELLEALKRCQTWLQGSEPGRAKYIGEVLAKAEGT